MKHSIQFIALSIFAFLVVAPPPAFSEVKISLKNGRDIIAESCRDTKDKFICEKMGGVFEIDKRDVLDVKGITIEHASSSQVSEETKKQEPESGKKEADKPEADLKDPEKQPLGDLVKGLKPEEEARLDQIRKRQLELAPEREKLIKERDQLHEDVKNQGMIKTQEQYDAIKKRISDLEAKINGFNDEVKKLNEEGKGITEGAQKK